MNFWEKYGTLVAMSLCGVSLIPTASLASAQEELEGNQDRETIEASKDTAISWKEVQPVPYYEEEEVCIQPQAAALAEEAKNVETAAEEAAADEVTVEAVREEKAPVMAAPEDAVEIAAVEIAAVEIAAVEQEAPAAVYDVPVFSDYAVQAAAETVEEQPEAFAQETVPAQAEVSVPVWDAAPAPEAEASAPVWEAAPAPEAEMHAEVQEAAPVQSAADPAGCYDDLNKRIADSAIQLVGTTDGMWCTEVVQMALAEAGVADAMSMWPDEYAQVYGYYTDTPSAGNLIFYDNGGQGYDHIAVYIGNGQAVHGNFISNGESKTVVYSAEVEGAGTPQYIQVVR